MTGARVTAVEIDARAMPAPTPELEQERRVAIFDLVEQNSLAPAAAERPGPYRLGLAVEGRRLRFRFLTEDGAEAAGFDLALAPFAQVVRDYRRICESYFDAVKRAPPAKIEALDEGRRAIHGEGARLLAAELEGRAELDTETARRLFTLLSVLDPGA